MSSSIKIISWNVNGIRAQLKKGFYDKIKELNPDILCLQETKATAEIVEDITKGMKGYTCVAHEAEKKGYSGTAIISKIKPIQSTKNMGVDVHDHEGRIVTTEYEHFYLINVYVPNSGSELKRLDYRKKWDKDFLNFITKLQKQKPVILTGDLNVAHEAIDLARPDSNFNKTAGYTQTEIDGFKNMLKAGLTDSFRKIYPEKVQYTFWNVRFKARERNVGWRIDYFIVSDSIFSKVKDSSILNDVHGSDHCPIQLDITF